MTSVAESVNGIAFLEGAFVVFEHDGSETTRGGFTYTLSDGMESDEGEVIVNVSPVNDPPVANTDRFVVDQGGALSIFASELVMNDVDADGDILRVTAVSSGVNGSVRLEGAAIVFQHDGSNTTTGGFTYSFTDGLVGNTGDVIVDVTPINKPPKAFPDRLQVVEGETLLVDASTLLENDTDADADTLMVTAVGNGINGRVLIEGNNIAFEHDGSEESKGGFTYTLSDGLESDAAFVSVSVLPKNDPPSAKVDIASVNEGGILSLEVSELLANDIDVEGDTLQVVAVGDALNGEVRLEGGSIIYQHDDSETTNGGFVYTVSDGAATDTSRVSVSVTPTNDPPVAGIDILKVDEGGVALAFVSELLENDSDVDGNSLQLSAVGSPLNGQVLLEGNTVVFEHDGSETIRAGFNYTLTDGVETIIGQVQVEVTPTNDPPVAGIDILKVDEGGVALAFVSELLENDSDVDGNSLRLSAVGSPLNGQVLLEGNKVVFEHDGSETIRAGFNYTLTDGVETIIGQVQVEVTPTNDPPVAGIDILQVDEGGVALASVSELLENDSDVDGNSLQLSAVGSPSNGRVLLEGNKVVFEHDGSETIRAGFNYTLTDGVETIIGQVQVEVTRTNDAPVPITDRFQVDEGGKLILEAWDLLKNDTDEDGDGLEVVSVGRALNGQVQLSGTQVRYEHDGSETTSGGFEYVISDGSGAISGDVHIDVAPASHFPTILFIALVASVGLAAAVLFILIGIKRSR